MLCKCVDLKIKISFMHQVLVSMEIKVKARLMRSIIFLQIHVMVGQKKLMKT